MSDDDISEVLQRIEERLSVVGKSEREASIQAFGHAGGIRNMRRGASKSPGISTFAKLAGVLDTTPQWLAFGVDTGTRELAAFAPRDGIKVIGSVSAGNWMEIDKAIDYAVWEGAPVPPDPRWPAEVQFGVVVRGQSVNRVARDGDIIACVDTREVSYAPQQNDLVIVERRRDAGQLVERTAKRFRLNGRMLEFWPDSDDPEWTKPIVVDPDSPDESTAIEIIGRATYVHAPIR